MAPVTGSFEASDGHRVFCYRWLPEGTPRAIVHIAHGMGEHAGRYDWVATRLTGAGYAVVADDHRGHGKTAATLGQFGADGWNRIIADLHEMIVASGEASPGVPRVLFGHSMGAMLTEQYIELHGDTIDAAVLSGSPGFTATLQAWILRLVVRFERWRLGPQADSPLLQSLVFGAANKPFEAATQSPTGFEWLSRDPEQVKAYVDDPACGFVPCTDSLYDLFTGAAWTQKASSIQRIPQHLPILVFSGSDDPVHGQMKNLNRLLGRYRDRGLVVDTRFYEGGRHETLNDIDRETVIGDVIDWLNRHTG